MSSEQATIDLPTTTPPGYIGVFSDPEVQAPIDALIKRLSPGQSGFALHYDINNALTLSIVQRVGSHISVEFAMSVPKGDNTFSFDPSRLKVEAQLLGTWGG
jgi:hypothetical protein